MVKIDADSYLTQERGICERVKEQMTNEVFELLDETEKTNKEYATAFVEEDDRTLHATKVISGEEDMIANKSVTELRLDVPGAVDDYNANVNHAHLLHTHPGGFPELSLEDMVVQIRELDKGIQFQSSLVATMFGGAGGDSALITGMELINTPSEEEKQRMDTVSNSVVGMVRSGEIAPSAAKDRLWEELDGFYQTCSVKIERGK